MENFNYYNPVSIHFGQGEIDQLGKLVALQGQRVLLLSYRDHDFMRPLLDKAIRLLEEAGAEVAPFFEIVANPMLSTIEKAVDLCRKEKYNVIVAIGGGSVIDSAKVIAGGVDYPHKIWDMVVSNPRNDHSIPPETALPIVCVSTIPATGSEMNCGAVITNDYTQEKAHLYAPCLFPKVAILDPELTCTLPNYQTGCGIADAISHVFEVYMNNGHQAPLQRRIMNGVVETLIESAPQVLTEPNNIEARSVIQWTACVAWNGWTHTGVNFSAPMHMIAHPMSARHNVTHGASLSIIMPAYMKYTCAKNPEIYYSIGQHMLGMDPDKDDISPLAVISKFEHFLQSIGTPTRLSECNIHEDDLALMVDDCERIGFSDKNTLEGLVPLTKEDVLEVLKLAL